MFLADFHIHSNFSDGKLSIPEIVDLYGERGFGAIAITDHVTDPQNTLGRSSAYLGCSLTRATFPLFQAIMKSERERAWDQYGMVLIPGLELTHNSISNHRSAHVIALGVDRLILPEGDVTEWIDRIQNAGGLAVAAHPVFTRVFEKQTFHLWDRREELKDKLDAWEIASGRFIFEEVKNSKLPVLANSDLHRPSQLTSWKTAFSCERHPEAILKSIQKQELTLQYHEEVPRDVVTRARFRWDMDPSPWNHPLGDMVCPSGIFG